MKSLEELYNKLRCTYWNDDTAQTMIDMQEASTCQNKYAVKRLTRELRKLRKKPSWE